LRNLTAKEIVRADSRAGRYSRWGLCDSGASNGLLVKSRVTFGCVVFARTSWSTHELDHGQDEGTYVSSDYSYRRGVRAGHCFDVTATQRYQ
jgi:hypothetical protein